MTYRSKIDLILMEFATPNERYVNFYTDFAFKKLFTVEEMRSYRESQKDFWDFNNTLDTAEKKGEERGMAKGMEKGVMTVAKSMKQKGFSTEVIVEVTGLSAEDIQKL